MTKNRDKSLSGEEDREKDESAFKAQRKGFTNNQDHRRREYIWLQILVCRSHQTRENWKRDSPEGRLRSPGTLHIYTWMKTAPDKKNTVDRKKIYYTSTEAHFLPYVHLLVQAHHSTAKHTSHNSRVMATRLPGLSRAKQLKGKWHWAFAWKPQDSGSMQAWFWMASFNSSNHPTKPWDLIIR